MLIDHLNPFLLLFFPACIGSSGPGVAAENLKDYYAAECMDGFVTLEKEFQVR